MHEDNENYASLLFQTPPVGHAVRIAFIILYIIITGVIYRLSSKYGGGYGKTANIFIFVGFLVGLFIMWFEDWLDLSAPGVVMDGRTNKILAHSGIDDRDDGGGSSWSGQKQKASDKDTGGGGIVVVEKDNAGLWDTPKQRKQMMYILYNDTLQKLIQSKKIKVTTFQEWISKKHKPHVWTVGVSKATAADHKFAQVPWSTAKNHCIFLLAHTLTLAYIVGHWDIKVFKSIFIWVASAATIAVSTLLWFNPHSYFERRYILYFVKKLQFISSGLALIAILGFIGTAAFKK